MPDSWLRKWHIFYFLSEETFWKCIYLPGVVTACPPKIIDIFSGYCRRGTTNQERPFSYLQRWRSWKKLIVIELRFSFRRIWPLTLSCIIVGTLCFTGVNNQAWCVLFSDMFARETCIFCLWGRVKYSLKLASLCTIIYPWNIIQVKHSASSVIQVNICRSLF